MNSEEQLAKRFLIERGFKAIVFEPNGFKKSPDFSIEGSIAIEVRRLNKQIERNGKVKPIEDLEYELIPKFKKLLEELHDPNLEYSIGVVLSYKRPVNISKAFLFELKESIVYHSASNNFKRDIKFNNKVTYSLWKRNRSTTQSFELVGKHDYDKGGVVQDDRYEALKIAIGEKSKKLSHLKDDFKEIWLVLIDDIFSRVDKSSVALSRYPNIDSIFDRIILVSKLDFQKWIDIHPWVD